MTSSPRTPEARYGGRFGPGSGRVMKEWLAVPVTSPADWLTLAREAKEFVASKGASPGQASTAES